MKRLLIACAMVLALGLYGGVALAQQGMQQQGQGGWFCPWCGQQSGQMGPGMHGRGMMHGPQGQGMMHHGYGQGRGMMHRGYGQGRHMGPGMMHHGWGRGQYPSAQGEQMQVMSKNKVRMLLEEYVATNPNLKVGEIEEEDEVYMGRIETKDGSLVERILVDKETGWMKRAY